MNDLIYDPKVLELTSAQGASELASANACVRSGPALSHMTGLQISLDQMHTRILAGDVAGGIAEICKVLLRVRLDTEDEHWRQDVRPLCDAHPLRMILQQDPLTARARMKPRGYAGDAPMLDFMYFRDPPEGTTKLGIQAFTFTTRSAAGQAVLWRKNYLGYLIDETADCSRNARILSLACGHLREAAVSRAIAHGGVRELVAMDQDPESLAVVASEYANLPVTPTTGSVRGVLKGDFDHNGGFDLIYASGLFDYLSDPVAQALSARLFSQLAPRGKLVVPNFLSECRDRGYMESFMDWHLIVRNRARIESLGDKIPASQIRGSRYFEDPYGAVGYLEVLRGGRRRTCVTSEK